MSLGYAGIFFYVLAGMALLSSIMVVTRRNPVHSAMFLVFAFFCVAGIYITLIACRRMMDIGGNQAWYDARAATAQPG